MNNSQSIHETSRLSSRNQIVIPSGIRKALNIKSGDKLSWRIISVGKSKKILAEPTPKSWTKYSLGLGKEIWKNVDIDEYINNLRNEWENQK